MIAASPVRRATVTPSLPSPPYGGGGDGNCGAVCRSLHSQNRQTPSRRLLTVDDGVTVAGGRSWARSSARRCWGSREDGQGGVFCGVFLTETLDPRLLQYMVDWGLPPPAAVRAGRHGVVAVGVCRRGAWPAWLAGPRVGQGGAGHRCPLQCGSWADPALPVRSSADARGKVTYPSTRHCGSRTLGCSGGRA
jgi:hypothetical protein